MYLLFMAPPSVPNRCGFRTDVPSSVSRSAQPTPKPTTLVATQAAPAAAVLEERRAENRDLPQTMMSPKSPPAAPHLTARPPCRAQPAETWAALPA